MLHVFVNRAYSQQSDKNVSVANQIAQSAALHVSGYPAYCQSSFATNVRISFSISDLISSGTVARPLGAISLTKSSTLIFSSPLLAMASLQYSFRLSTQPLSTSRFSSNFLSLVYSSKSRKTEPKQKKTRNFCEAAATTMPSFAPRGLHVCFVFVKTTLMFRRNN